MNIYKSAGVAIGLFVGMILTVFLLKFANKNHRTKTEYDERQKEIRGRGYMYGFYTIVILEAVMIILGIGHIPLPIEDYLVRFGCILAGMVVLCGYCIWNGVYWGLNNDRRRYMIVFIIAAVLNMLPAAVALKSGAMMENGKLGLPFLNVMVLVMMVILCVLLGVREILDRREAEEE